MRAYACEFAIESLACLVLVGVDVEHERGAILWGWHPSEYLQVFGLEEGGRGDGYRLVTCREERQAVGDTLTDEEGLARREMAHYREVEHVDAAARWEAESGLAFLISQIAALHILHLAVEVAIRDEERGGIIKPSAETPTGGRGGDAADAYPLYHLGAQVALLVEERLGLSY